MYHPHLQASPAGCRTCGRVVVLLCLRSAVCCLQCSQTPSWLRCIPSPRAQLRQPVAGHFGISGRHVVIVLRCVLSAGSVPREAHANVDTTPTCTASPSSRRTFWRQCLVSFRNALLCAAPQAVFPDTSLANVYATTAARREAVAASSPASSSPPRRRQAHSLPQIVHAQGFDRYVSAGSRCL